MLVGPVKERLEQIIPEVVDEHNWQIVELAIQPDHVPLFVRSNPYTLPSDSPRRLKGRSSRFLRDEFPPAEDAIVMDTRVCSFDCWQCEQ